VVTACDVVRVGVGQSRQEFESFVSTVEESCTEARRWVEREIRTPIERHRTRTERRCRREECYWLCLCCNKLICWVETVFERFIEYVVEVVGEWVVETVCKVLTKAGKIAIELMITVGRLLVVGAVCLFTDPRGALDAVIDTWFDVVDLVGDAGDLIGDAIAAVGELLDITREYVLDIGDRFGLIGRFIAGLLAGLIDIVRRVVDGIGRILDGIFDLLIGILHLDFCAALEGLVNGIVFGLAQVIFGVTGLLTLGSAGIRDADDRARLRGWLQRELEIRFRGDRLARLEEVFQMDSTSFGARWPVQPLRCTISSHSKVLRTLHINLFEVAGYAPIGCREAPVTRAAWRLVYKDTDYRVSLGDLRAFLERGPDAAPEFQLIAGEKRVLQDMLRVAKRKFRQLAIKLDPASLETFEVRDAAEMIIGFGEADRNPTPLATRIKSQLGLSNICDLPGVVVFGYQPQLNGLAIGDPTTATARSNYVARLFGILLAHEMGHCFNLDHPGHDGLENIMFTAEKAEQLDPITGNTFVEYVLLGGEPRFSRDDAITAWTWILTEGNRCF
jgi:hypothetical protein